MPEDQFLKAEHLKAYVSDLPLIAFAHPTPERLEFTFACDRDYAGPAMPAFVKEFILNKLASAGLFQAVMTEVPGFGVSILCSIICPAAGGSIGATAEGE